MKYDQRKEALTQAVLENISALTRFANSLCHDKSEAEELVSETVVKAFENMHRLKDQGKMKQWLFRIMNNIFLSDLRKNKNQRKISLDSSQSNDESFSLYEQISSSNFTDANEPEKNFISKITIQKIREAIDKLPEEFRVTLTLCDVEEFSYAEISFITQTPIGTVRSRIARARNILQKMQKLIRKMFSVNFVNFHLHHSPAFIKFRIGWSYRCQAIYISVIQTK